MLSKNVFGVIRIMKQILHRLLPLSRWCLCSGYSGDEGWQALLSPMREQVFEKLCNAMLAALSQAPAAEQEVWHFK